MQRKEDTGQAELELPYAMALRKRKFMERKRLCAKNMFA
jgi:hypothetical protein